MTGILGKYFKQPDEVLAYPVSFEDWFSNRADEPDSFTVAAEPGITIVSSEMSGNVVRVILSGGTHGGKYKVTVKLTTTSALVKEADFVVAVKAV